MIISFFKFLKFLFIIIFVLVLFLLVYSFFVEPNILRVYEKSLYLPNFNIQHNGLRVAIMSDFHFFKYGITESKLKKIVAKTNSKHPDLIFLLGDFDVYSILNNNLNIYKLAYDFSKFESKYGVFAVLGNHDYNKDKTINKMLRNSNISLLEDNFAVISINNKNLKVYGFRDLWHFNYNKTLLDKKFDNDSSIILAHNPDIFPLLPQNISLAISGHTHGGQFYFPFIGGLFFSSKYKQRYIKGYIVENNKHLFVTSGLGNWIPFRFGNPPEIVILNLYSQSSFPKYIIFNTPVNKGITNFNVKKFFIFYIKLLEKSLYN